VDLSSVVEALVAMVKKSQVEKKFIIFYGL